MKPSQAKNLYEILEIGKNSSPAEIDNAFRRQAFIWHPDKHVDDYQNADAEFKILMNAYCILSDPVRKRDYDRYHFKQNINPNYGKYRDQRLTAYRARQRTIVNRLLVKNQGILKRYRTICKYSILAMIASGGLLIFSAFLQQNRGLPEESDIQRYLFVLPLLLFNGALLCYAISKKEIVDHRKKHRSLAIKLYSYVDEQ